MKRKVLFIDQPLDPPGGGQKSLLLIMSNLPSERYEVSLAVPEGPEGGFFREAAAAGIVPRKVRVSFFAVRSLLRSVAPDLVHCNSATTRLSFLAALNARLMGIPFVWHVRVTERAGWKDRVIAALSGRIVAISDAVAVRFSGCRGKVVKIYNAVDTRSFVPGKGTEKIRGELGIFPGAEVVGMIGRLVGLKGHRIFLRMARIMRETRPGCAFLVAGAGEESYAAELKRSAEELGLGGQVFFTGHRDDIPELISLCSVVVAPSEESEAFNRVLIEAMACGKPVVARAAGGMPEVVGSGREGILVAGGEASDYAAAVTSLLADPAKAAEMGRRGLEKARSLFSVERQMGEIESVYSELLPQAGSG